MYQPRNETNDATKNQRKYEYTKQNIYGQKTVKALSYARISIKQLQKSIKSRKSTKKSKYIKKKERNKQYKIPKDSDE